MKERCMDMVNMIYKQEFIFNRLISLSNKLQTIGDRAISDNEITIGQWLLLVVIAQFGGNTPTLKKTAEVMDSSHQNVKQLALKLQKRGYIYIEKDEKDQRSINLKLTDKSYLFLREKQPEVSAFLIELFKNLSDEEIHMLEECLNKINLGIMYMERALTGPKLNNK